MYVGGRSECEARGRQHSSFIRLHSVTGKEGRKADTGYMRRQFLMNYRLRYPLMLYLRYSIRSAFGPSFL